MFGKDGDCNPHTLRESFNDDNGNNQSNNEDHH